MGFHINKTTPDYEAGRSNRHAVSFNVSRPAGAKPHLIARQYEYIEQLVAAIRDLSVTGP
jgi:hypothetical protein